MNNNRFYFLLICLLWLGSMNATAQRRMDLEKLHKNEIKQLKKLWTDKKEKVETVTIEDFVNGSWYYVVVKKDDYGRKYYYDQQLNPLNKGIPLKPNDTFSMEKLSNGQEYVRVESGSSHGYMKRDLSITVCNPASEVNIVEVAPGVWLFDCSSYHKGDPTSPYKSISDSYYYWYIYEEATGKCLASFHKDFDESKGVTLDDVLKERDLLIVKASSSPEERTLTIGNNSINIWSEAAPFYVSSNTYDGKHVMASHGYTSYFIMEGTSMRNGVVKDRDFPMNKPLLPYGYDVDNVKTMSIQNRMDDDGMHTDLVMDMVIKQKEMTTANNKKIISTPFDHITYTFPEHAFYYRYDEGSYKISRGRVGAVFVRDTMLNVPPQFYDVRYVEEDGNWKPLVKRKAFAPWEYYVKGNDYTPVYISEAEESLDNGAFNDVTNFYWRKYNKDWSQITAPELKVLTAAMLAETGKVTENLNKWAAIYLKGEDAEENYQYIYTHRYKYLNIYRSDATVILDRFLASIENEAERQYAEDLVLAIDQAYIEYNEANNYCEKCKKQYQENKRQAQLEAQRQAAQAEIDRVQREEQARIQRQQQNAMVVAALLGGIANMAANIASGSNNRSTGSAVYKGGGNVYKGGGASSSSSKGVSSEANDRAIDRKYQEKRLQTLQKQRADFVNQLERAEQEIANSKSPSHSAISLKQNCERHIRDIDNEINQIKNSY